MNLEDLITKAYEQHQADARAAEQARLDKENQLIETNIAKFKQSFDQAIQPEMQDCIGIKIAGSTNQAFATFTYKSVELTIYIYGHQWRVVPEYGSGFDDFVVDTENLLDGLLVVLGKIRESGEPEPKEMTTDEAISNLTVALNKAKEVREHKHDFFHNPESFGEDLDTAICLLKKALNDLVGEEIV